MENIKSFISYPGAITFIGMVIAAIGAFSKAKQSKKVVFIGTLIVAIGAFWSEGESNRFESKLKNLNAYILSSVTGGDSFCRLSLLSINSNTNEVLLCIVHMGEYPLYEVSCRIADLEKLKELSDNFTYDDMLEKEIHINIGNLAPGISTTIGKLNLGPGDEKKYNIFFTARNGFFSQLIRLKRIRGKWVTATKVMKGNTNLWKRVDSEFPRNKAGEVDWNDGMK